jgi:hypothetical protein
VSSFIRTRQLILKYLPSEKLEKNRCIPKFYHSSNRYLLSNFHLKNKPICAPSLGKKLFWWPQNWTTAVGARVYKPDWADLGQNEPICGHWPGFPEVPDLRLVTAIEHRNYFGCSKHRAATSQFFLRVRISLVIRNMLRLVSCHRWYDFVRYFNRSSSINLLRPITQGVEWQMRYHYCVWFF